MSWVVGIAVGVVVVAAAVALLIALRDKGNGE
jgi:hypothetical protein